MKKLNHYQKDVLFILLLMGLQLVFSYFYPFRNPDTASAIEVSRSFLFISFEFIDSGVTSFYTPFLSIIYVLLLVYLLLQKKRRFALIYGFALVLVVKAYYLMELYNLEGIYTDLVSTGVLSKKLLSEGEVIAQDLTFYVLGVLFILKVGIYVHDYVMFRKTEKPQSQS